MRTILYISALTSAKNSSNVQFLKSHFEYSKIIAPELPTSPIEAVEYLHNEYEQSDIDLIVASGLGALYALTFPKKKKLLINPSIRADEDIKAIYGEREYFFKYQREDDQFSFLMDKNYYDELYRLRNAVLYGSKAYRHGNTYKLNPKNTYILFTEKNKYPQSVEVARSLLEPDHIDMVSRSGATLDKIPGATLRIQKVLTGRNAFEMKYRMVEPELEQPEKVKKTNKTKKTKKRKKVNKNKTIASFKQETNLKSEKFQPELFLTL